MRSLLKSLARRGLPGPIYRQGALFYHGFEFWRDFAYHGHILRHRIWNKYRDRRCFVIGNGPSLGKMDLSPLRDEITIGCNGLFLLFEKLGFLPTYYTVEDV